jgi:hypothetical protein
MGKSKVARRKAAHARKTAQEEHHDGEAVQSVDTKTAPQNGRPAAAVANGDTMPRNDKTEMVGGRLASLRTVPLCAGRDC